MTQTSEVIRFAGDVSVEKVKIINPYGLYYDMTGQVLGIQIFEDLFTPFLSGSIFVKDSLDIINALQMTGEEYVEISISTPTLGSVKIEGSFYIYKAQNREILGDRAVSYQIDFISNEAIVDLNSKISKTYSGKVSDIAREVLTSNYGLNVQEKPIFIEDTINTTKYISNYWSPVRNMVRLCESAVNKRGSPSYTFFENRDGFYFVSLDHLYSLGEPVQEFFYDVYLRDDTSDGGDIRNVGKGYQRIKNIEIPVVYDYMDRIRSGVISSKRYTFDLMRKTLSATTFDCLQEFNDSSHLNKNPLFRNDILRKPEAKVIISPSYFNNFSQFVGDPSNSTIAQKRISHIKSADISKVTITVPGRVDYTVGQKVKLILNRMEQFTDEESDTIDRMFSGNYLMRSINHYVDRESHECKITLIRDSSMQEYRA